MGTEADTKRADIVREALSWIDTPFHDGAGIKGAGCDCAHLLIRVYASVGLIPGDFEPERYSPQWFQHRDEPRFLNKLAEFAHRVDAPRPGDVAMFNYGRHAAHAAILVDARSIVHAFKPARRVMRDALAPFLPILDSYWSFTV